MITLAAAVLPLEIKLYGPLEKIDALAGGNLVIVFVPRDLLD